VTLDGYIQGVPVRQFTHYSNARLLDCERAHTYLVADFNRFCYDAQWQSYLIFDVFMLVVYPFGVPAFFLYLLLQNRDKFRRPEVRMEIGFLFDGCSPSVWYFELVDMTHNLILTSILGFLPLSLQLPFGMATCVAMLCFILLTAPYFRAGDDFLHLLVQAELFLWSVVHLAVCAFAAASEVGWILDCSRDSSKIIIGSDDDRLMHVWSTRTGQVSMPR